MRRFAAVALSAGVLMTGGAVVGSPAQAAPTQAAAVAAPNKAAVAAYPAWKPYNSYSYINAWGNWARNSSKAVVTGKLQDTKKNNWTACVRFLFTERSGNRDLQYWSRHYIVGVNSNGTRYAFDGKGTISFKVTSYYTHHLWVQECGRSKKTGKFVYGKGKKLY
ncbi:hypothetical protein [Spirillospora sp. NPDC047279]|uniref:hypothetical protein n=1 Tax=Spirillospora sp. NPDC047279 TaxID=3155478 RepID=UPI0033CA8113